MAFQIIPQQNRINDPFSQILFQFNQPHSNLYLSKPLNSLSRIIGNNLVTRGLDLDSYSLSDSNIFSVTITSGSCIVDHIFHEISEPTTLSLDVSLYDDQNGKLVVFINYQFLQTTELNPLRFKLCYVSNDGNTVLPVEWSPADQVVLAVFSYNLSTKEVTEETDPITILGRTYYIKGRDPNTDMGISVFVQQSLDTDFGTY